MAKQRTQSIEKHRQTLQKNILKILNGYRRTFYRNNSTFSVQQEQETKKKQNIVRIFDRRNITCKNSIVAQRQLPAIFTTHCATHKNTDLKEARTSEQIQPPSQTAAINAKDWKPWLSTASNLELISMTWRKNVCKCGSNLLRKL